MSKFQTAWCLESDDVHVTFAGHLTPCDLAVLKAAPYYESKAKDITCRTCGAYLVFDVEAACEAAVHHIENHPASAGWDSYDRFSFGRDVALRVAEVGFLVRKEYGRWNSNHVFSEFMAGTALMAGQSAVARLVGSIAQAVLDVLKEQDGAPK
ncbi:hypothetical protein AB0J38_41070 [Streptomyces sp. NPDC050095]|uniref:hypothetical protein n=1 Tax=unclassified Streptomyces TaxID=2593676 RepID=UPI0034444F91